MFASCIFPPLAGLCGAGNPLSKPPGEYDRKVKTQRNWRGGTQPVEHVVQFDTNRRTSPRLDILAFYFIEIWEIRKEARTGAAWLSSARSVRSTLKWDNERNPYSVLYLSQKTASTFVGEEGGADVKSAWSLCLGQHTCYNEKNNESCHLVIRSKSLKSFLSGDWGLQLDLMNAELVVIADQSCRGEYVLASCTHRPSSQQSRSNLNPDLVGRGLFRRWGLSRNKVSVLEEADGSPPFFFSTSP